MNVMTNINNEIKFRNYQQYKDYFTSSPEKTSYPGKSDDYVLGAEIARKAFDTVRQKMDEDKKRAPWEKDEI